VTTLGVTLGGACAALAAGALLGGAMKPDLPSGDLARGPQQLAGRSALRAKLPIDQGAAMAAYHGKIPEYVLGADARPQAGAPGAAAPDPGGQIFSTSVLNTGGVGPDPMAIDAI
jgi:hypothetical protein